MTDEPYVPMTAATPCVESFCAANAAVFGSPPSSSVINSTCLPSKPPFAFTSSTSNSTICFISWPSLAQEPVSGAIKPIFTVSAAIAAFASRPAAHANNTSFFIRCCVPLLDDRAAGLHRRITWFVRRSTTRTFDKSVSMRENRFCQENYFRKR